jgi:hypothetical protein
MLINEEATLKDEYARLAILERALRKKLESGIAICLNCKRAKSDHRSHDERCNSYVTSTHFRCAEAEQLSRVTSALQLIEDLQAIESC